MSGNRNLLLHFSIVFTISLLWLNDVAEACPACVVSSKETSAQNNFWALSFMGIAPLVIGCWVFYKISRIQNNESQKKPHA